MTTKGNQFINRSYRQSILKKDQAYWNLINDANVREYGFGNKGIVVSCLICGSAFIIFGPNDYGICKHCKKLQ